MISFMKSQAVSTSTFFLHKNIPFLCKKGTFEGLADVALSRGQDIPGHSKVSFPLLNYSPFALAVLLVVMLVVVL
jgi:hypothetical protein